MLSTIGTRRRPLAAAIATFLLALIVAAPAVAQIEQGHTGTVGPHSLRDSSTKPGATCRFRRIQPSPGGYSYEAKLNRIDVRPPKVRAISGSQEVGWRFFVQRRGWESSGQGYGEFGPWVVTYQSPIQRDVTHAGTNASFTTMGIGVNVPTSKPFYEYRVQVKMFWYRPDGRTQGTATHRVEWYKSVYNNWPDWAGGPTYTDVSSAPCDDRVGFDIN